MDDKDLIARMQKGDPVAVEYFYGHYYQVFLRVALRMVGDFHVAQDLAHDAVLKAIANAGGYVPGRGTPKAWFLSVLGNTVRDWYRRMKLRRAASLSADDGAGDGTPVEVPGREPTPHERAEAEEKVAAVQAALLLLDADQRALIALRDFEGLSAPEAAAALGITTELVGSRLFRARGRLRALLEAHWPDLFAARER